MNQASHASLFRILSDASRSEIQERKQVDRAPALVFWRGFWIQAGILILALGVGFSYYFGVPPNVSYVGMVVIFLIFSVSVFVAPLVPIFLYRQSINEIRKNPIEIPLRHASITTTVDANALPLIMPQSLEDIELVRLELGAEREFFERRMAIIVGPIEKVGILPALLALGLAVQGLPSGIPHWIEQLAYAYAILYVLGFGAHLIMMRLDRMVKLFDLAVERKKAELRPPP